MPDYDLPQQVLTEGDTPIQPKKAVQPRLGARIPQNERDKWDVKCNSEQPQNGCTKAIEESVTTFWQTKTGAGGAQKPDSLPHIITVDLQINKDVSAVFMTPSMDIDLGGVVAGHKIYLSEKLRQRGQYEYKDCIFKFTSIEKSLRV